MTNALPTRVPPQTSTLARRLRSTGHADEGPSQADSRASSRLVPVLPRGRLSGTVAFHRDPLGQLRSAQARLGDVFSLRTLTAGTQVVVADPEAVRAIADSDPRCGAAGSARRAFLPVADARSVFGSDGRAHLTARGEIARAFSARASAARVPAIRRIAEHHVARWPLGRPFGLLARMRGIADEVFVRELLGVRGAERVNALVDAIGGLMSTPGNPPVTMPAARDGLVGRLVDVEFRRRRARVARILVAELRERRGGGERSDVLDLLLASEGARAPEALVDELLALLMAAQEPMAAALTWVALCASANPGPLEREGFDSDWGRAVVDESLRLHPPALGVLRRLRRDTRVAGHVLPGGLA